MDDLIQQAEARQVSRVAEEKKALAPTRAAAEQALREATARAAKYRPRFLAKQAQMSRIARILGAVPLSLDWHLKEALGAENRIGALESIPETFKGIIAEIDGLTEWQVHQGVHLRIPGRLQAATSNLNEFERLARLIDQDFKDLEPALERAAG